MKLFVATKQGQGVRDNDFCWVPEDELVKFGMACDDTGIDGNCGCMRSMCGVDSHTATTTFKVINLKMTKEEFIRKLVVSYKLAGWGEGEPEDKIVKTNTEEAEELIRMADTFDVGDVCEKRGPDIQTRGGVKKDAGKN